MLEHKQMIHDLALVYVSEKFRCMPDQDNLQELIGLYYDAVTYLVDHLDEIESGYLDDKGNLIV